MPSDAEIDALYASTLRPRLDALEDLRRSVKSYRTKAGLLVGVPAVLLALNGLVEMALPEGLAWMALVVPFIGVFAGILVAAFKYALPGFAAYGNYRTRFKHEVAAEVFTIVCPSATYSPHDGILKDVFDEPGLFNTRGGFRSDDLVRGRIGETPFEAADVSRSYTTGGKNSTTVVVFRGLFFHIDFNKTLRGVTLVDPVEASSSTTGARVHLSRITLENPDFDRAFAVYATDDVEARYILTPSMMARVLALRARSSHPVHLAFTRNRAYLGVNYGRALFEPGIASTTSLDAIREMAAQFAFAEAIVRELDLNTRIWTKDVDEALLATPVAEERDALSVAMRRGDVTAEQLWDAATAAAGEGAASVPDHVGPPASTSIAIDHTAGETVVNYGFGVGFFVAAAVWAAATALALAAARILPEAMEMRELAPFVAWIPEIPYASVVVTTWPIVWLAGATLVGSFAFLMWAVRVRKVAIAPDAVRIWRGLRPLPRRYARPPYGKVVCAGNCVYIGRTEGFSLINASASPVLAEDEALWVAAEMRRALTATKR